MTAPYLMCQHSQVWGKDLKNYRAPLRVRVWNWIVNNVQRV